MVGIVDWLKRHGLEKYASVFEESAIDLDVLADISEDDLASIGIPLGDRKRIVRAIKSEANTGTGATASQRQAPVAGAEAPNTSAAGADEDAERKHLTVLFCDLVGSTQIANRLDPEDLSQLLKRYHEVARECVERYGGQVAQYLGDGVLAYFGHPVAHEDDAERAVRAASDVLARTAGTGDGRMPQLHARAGIATGEAVLRDLASGAGWSADSVVGRTMNLAARVQSEADADHVVIEKVTYRLLGQAFDATPLGARQLKGFPEPIELWRVDATQSSALRFEATRGRRLSPMVGRTEELAALRRRWEEARSGHGSAVVIEAEAGVGKSRLLHELRQGVSQATVIVGQCLSYGTVSPLLPLKECLRQLVGVRPQDSLDATRERVTTYARTHGVAEARLIGALHGLLEVAAADDEILRVPAEVRQARTFEALRSLLVASSQTKSILLAIEDLHWADAASEALLSGLVDMLESSRILFIATHRAERRLSWSGRPGVLHLALSLLGREDTKALLTRVLGERAANGELVDKLAMRAQGNPLFIEELSLSVKEAGPDEQLPETIQSVLMARIDGLPRSVRRALQTASVLGREFRRQLLQEVWQHAERLEELIHALENLELVHERLERDESILAFRHALVQDAAYSTLIKSRRRELHLTAARTIERLFLDSADDTLASLAYHYAGAERPVEAIRCLMQIADRARKVYALADARSALTEALELVGRIDDPEAMARERLRIKLVLAQVLYLLGRFQDSVEILESERPALQGGRWPELTGQALFWIGHMAVRQARYAEAEAAAHLAISQAEAIRDRSTVGKALGLLCLQKCLTGASIEAATFGARSIHAMEEANEPYWLAMSLFYQAMVEVQMGAKEEALQLGARVVEVGNELGDPRLKTYGLFVRGWAMANAEDPAAVTECELATSNAPDPTSLAYATGFLAFALLQAGRIKEALKAFEAAIDSIRSIGFRPFQSLFLAYQAEAQRRAGALDAARASAHLALDAAASWPYPLGEAWGWRALGRAHAAMGEAASAKEAEGKAATMFAGLGAQPGPRAQ
jgi:class 3 adenylate cyclase/tetratricopeptide (TPR) repeat protein